MREYLTSGTLPRPPQTLDTDYPAGGGAWVSLRSRENIHVRHARDGFWNFPGEEAWPAPEAVLWAALKTAETLPREEALALLDDSAIAVTFFTAMEECPVGALDNDRYGIVVRSLERPGWMGGALPRMPGILNEWDQYQHARITNAGLISFEPHVILRHDVIKAVEPGVSWQPTGVPSSGAAHPLTQAERGGMVAARGRDLAVARLFGTEPRTAALRDDLLPSDTDQLYVSVYLAGRLRGCLAPCCAGSTRMWRRWWRPRWAMRASRRRRMRFHPRRFPSPSRCCTTALGSGFIPSRTSSAASAMASTR